MKTTVCTGIAYDWLLGPPHPDEHDFTIVIATCRTVIDSRDSPVTDHRTYHARFRPPGQPFQLVDVSGTLGLLWQTTEPAAQEKAATFERMLADALIWTLGDMDFLDSSEHVILVQGPLIPKLRGRHLYRGVDLHVPVYSVTFQREWFSRLEAAQTRFLVLPPNHKPQVADVYPPKPIDRATRSWVCRLPGEEDPGQPLHFEVIANMWDCWEQVVSGERDAGDAPSEGADATNGKSKNGWLDERKRQIEILTSTAQLETISEDEDTRLPYALALAVREARKWKEFEDKFSKVFRLAEERLRVKGALDRERIVQPLRLALGPGFRENAANASGGADLLKAATTGSAELDCEASYEHLQSKWTDKTVRKTVEDLLGQPSKRRRA